MPARRPAQRVKDASLLDPPCRPIALRHRRQNLAPRAHADNSRHERHPADSAALTQSSAETSSVTFLVRQCASLDDIAVVSEAIEQRGRHLGITEDTRPLPEREV